MTEAEHTSGICSGISIESVLAERDRLREENKNLKQIVENINKNLRHLRDSLAALTQTEDKEREEPMRLDLQHIFGLECELQKLITVREGMVAENQQRAFLGQAMAYVEDGFAVISEKIEAIRENLIRLGER